MSANKDCVDYARECIRLATSATDPDIRNQLLQMASDWMAPNREPSPKDQRTARGHLTHSTRIPIWKTGARVTRTATGGPNSDTLYCCTASTWTA
jgi:hypothetical protein